MDALEGMSIACLEAGMAFSNAILGAVHALAHVMGGLCHVSHGVANAVLLPYVMDFCRVGCREKYANVADLLGERTDGLCLDDASFLGIEAVRALSMSIDIPQRLRDLSQDVTEADLLRIVQTSMVTQARIYAQSPRTVSQADALSILQAAW